MWAQPHVWLFPAHSLLFFCARASTLLNGFLLSFCCSGSTTCRMLSVGWGPQ